MLSWLPTQPKSSGAVVAASPELLLQLCCRVNQPRTTTPVVLSWLPAQNYSSLLSCLPTQNYYSSCAVVVDSLELFQFAVMATSPELFQFAVMATRSELLQLCCRGYQLRTTPVALSWLPAQNYSSCAVETTKTNTSVHSLFLLLSTTLYIEVL